MSKTYAVINDNIVTNLVLWDGVSQWATSDTLIEVTNGTDCAVGYSYVDGNFIPAIPQSEQTEQERINMEAINFLVASDWKVLRHIRQQALGIATTLTAQEYLELEQQRQMAADSIV